MVITDTIEGIVDQTLWFHYDITNDVLYIHSLDRKDEQTYGEETPEGFILLRTLGDDAVAGIKVVDWWRRFGEGSLRSITFSALETRIEEWARRLAA